MGAKTIKIKYIDFWQGFDAENFYITQILRKRFNVVISDEPDFLICSVVGDQYYTFVDYPQPRIMYIGENYIPDLNYIDYAITPYAIQLYDRCFRLPYGFRDLKVNEYCTKKSKGEYVFDSEFLKKKDIFANFCASHESEYNIRGDFFKYLSEHYKKVDSIGSYLNNTGITVNRLDDSKSKYLKRCKFTLCFESTSHQGFNTEKLVEAYANDTIPVYYGDPMIGELYNKKAFIDISDYDNWDQVVDKIKELDQNDELYLEMINQPLYNDVNITSKIQTDYENFLFNIFEQSPEEAYRRSRCYFAKYTESFIKYSRRIFYSKPLCFARRLKKRFI